MKKIKCLYLLIAFLNCSFALKSQSLTFQDCRIVLKNDTLSITNSKIQQQFLWNSGQLIFLGINRAGTDAKLITRGKTPDFMEFGDSILSENAELKLRTNQFSAMDPLYLEAEIIYALHELQVKRTIRIFPNEAAITHFFSLKGKSYRHENEAPSDEKLVMIENNQSQKITSAGIGKIPLQHPHWQFEAISFTEATDHHNTLASSYNFAAYNKAERVQGNVLIGRNTLQNTGFFIIKESPLNNSQADYIGYDFEAGTNEVIIHGLGIPEENIKIETWTQGYGYTIGVGEADRNSLLYDAKRYQKQKRSLIESRDEMILANTWGDRSRDSRMTEAFILEELEACAKLGVTHLQLDDGWQQGLSRNSASKSGSKWDDWSIDDWKPNIDRFPNGFNPILESAKQKNIEICLWFNPGKIDEYANWERDADLLIGFYKNYGIKIFKIDGIDLSSKTAELNLRNFFEKVKDTTQGNVVFNIDVTAGQRMGYFYFMEYGNLFLENRYTDWGNYYPHSTLRNLWMLSQFIPAEKIQVEFLNKWRNPQKYQQNDPLAPQNIPFAYQIATTFAGQPLAWMEVSQLPEEAYDAAELIKKYKEIQHEFHKGIIMPVGDEPNGLNWTGFQSVINDSEGYILVFRAWHDSNQMKINTALPKSAFVSFEKVLGDGDSFSVTTNKEAEVELNLPNKHNFVMYKYTCQK